MNFLCLILTTLAIQTQGSHNIGISADDSSCACMNGDTGSFLSPHETLHLLHPGSTSSKAIRCVGGCDGGSFVMHSSSMTSVKILNVWTGHGVWNDGIKAIQVVYFNGYTQTEGVLPDSTDSTSDKTFTFEAGEVLDGQLKLSGNGLTGEHARAGYIEFKTNGNGGKGRTFSAGKAHKPVSVDVTGSLLSGFFGQAGEDVDQLGVITFKPIKSLKITNVEYPTLDNYLSGLSPSAVIDRPYCNNGDRDQTEVRTVKVETGSKSAWNFSMTESFEAAVGVEVEAGTPVVKAKAHADFKWGVSAQQSYTQEFDSKESVSEEFQITYQAHTMGRIQLTQFESRINIPWTGKEKVTFTDNTSVTMDVQGNYNGVYVSKIMPNYKITQCNPCVCDGETGGDGIYLVAEEDDTNSRRRMQNEVEKKKSGGVSQEFLDMFSEALSPDDKSN